MPRIEDSALVILAAGRSTRFRAPGGKLAHDLGGVSLGLHVARALAPLPFAYRLAVIGPLAPDYAALGVETIANPRPEDGLAGSLALGIARAAALGAGGALVALADMPRVTAAHVRRLFAAADGEGAGGGGAGRGGAVVASIADGAPSPPALFGAARFAALAALTGDAGARGLIRGGTLVRASADELVDVDTLAQFAALAAPPP